MQMAGKIMQFDPHSKHAYPHMCVARNALQFHNPALTKWHTSMHQTKYRTPVPKMTRAWGCQSERLQQQNSLHHRVHSKSLAQHTPTFSNVLSTSAAESMGTVPMYREHSKWNLHNTSWPLPYCSLGSSFGEPRAGGRYRLA